MQEPFRRLTRELAKVEQGQLKAYADKEGRVMFMIQNAPAELRRLADALEKVNVNEIQALVAYQLPEPSGGAARDDKANGANGGPASRSPKGKKKGA